MKFGTVVGAICAAIVLVGGWGFVAPHLLSSDSDLAVILGWIVIFSVPVTVYGIYREWWPKK